MIGERIKIARRKSGYSLRSLAVAIEGRVSAQMIGKYERNESTPSSATLVALADALQVPMEYLVSVSKPPKSDEGVQFRPYLALSVISDTIYSTRA